MPTKTSRTTRKVVRRSKGVELHAYIPDESVADRYVNRKVHGVWDAQLADIARMGNHNILLMGDTGAGKTLFGEAYAAKKRLRYYSLPCDVSIDPSALFGRMQPTEEVGKFEWQDGPITEIVRYGGVLNVSECNFMPPKIAASLFPLLDSRRYVPLLGHRGEVVRPPDGELLVIADLNPNYRGTIELNAAFLNRFEFKIPWGYDAEVEEQLVHFPTIRETAKELREMYGTELVTPISTNMLMEFEKFSQDDRLGIEFAIGNFVSAFRSDEQQAVTKVLELKKEDVEKDRVHYMKSLRRRKSNKADDEHEDDSELEVVEFDYEEDENS